VPTPAGAIEATSSSVLAFVSTVHLCLLLLRHHRSVRSLVGAVWLVPGAAFGVAAWTLSSPAWLAAGIAAHLAWFFGCEAALRRTAADGRATAPRATAVAATSAAIAAAPALPPHRGFVAAPVLAVVPETDDIATFRIARPDGFRFRAGQFLTVRVEVDGKPLVRCYSISSAPETPGFMEISVKRVGKVSVALHATVRAGSELHVKAPAGQFVYPEQDGRPLVLIAGGVGITPLASMLRHGLAAQPARPITLLYSVHSARGVAFRRELEMVAERHPQATVLVTVSDGAPAPGQLAGRVTEALLRNVAPDPTGSTFMLCGPDAMMKAVRAMLAALGVPAGQVHFEAFEAAVASAREHEAAGGPAPSLALDSTTPAPAVHRAASGGAFTLTLTQSGLSVPVSARQTLLDAAEAGGAAIPSSCRAGVCLTCRSRLVKGDVDCDSDSLDEADREAGYVLPCVAWAKCDCILEA